MSSKYDRDNYLDDLAAPGLGSYGGGLDPYGGFGGGLGGLYNRGNTAALQAAVKRAGRRERRTFEPSDIYYYCVSCLKVDPTFRVRCPCCGDINSIRDNPPQKLIEAHERYMSQPLRREGASDDDEDEDEFGREDGRRRGEEDEDDDEDDDEEEEQPPPPIKVRRLSSVKALEIEYVTTGDEILDHVWCGGAPKEHCLALSAPPGTGKSTILRRAAGAMSKDLTVMYVSGEESEGKIKAEFKRAVFRKFPYARKNVFIASANNPESIVAEAHKREVDVLIIDSLSHLQSLKVVGQMGKEAQMKHAATLLMDAAHGINSSAGMKPMIVLLIVHATKGGDMAGANAVKHVIDGAFFMEHIDPLTLQPVDDQNVATGYIRIRAHGKYRAGDITRVGYYKMTDRGLIPYKPKKTAASSKKAAVKKGAEARAKKSVRVRVR